MNRRVYIFAVVILAAVAACSHSGKFSSLVGQGVLALSPENPYFGANLFLSKEMERSEYLYNFCKASGSPAAIELDNSSGEIEIRMFYPQKNAVFVARLSAKEGREGQQWIIRGPYGVDREYARTLRSLSASSNREAIFDLWGKAQRCRNDYDEVEQKRELIVPVFVPTPTPRPTPRPIIRRATPSGPTATPEPTGPLNFDQQALLSRKDKDKNKEATESKDTAEKNLLGDVVHTVTAGTQTLDSIAAWYTGSSDNGKVLAEKNGLASDAKLNLGQKIIIPGSMVKNTKTMR